MILTPMNLGLGGILLAEIGDAKTGEVLARIESKNLVVTAGRNLARSLLIAAGNPITHFALGTSASAVQASDTALAAQVLREVFTSSTLDTGQITVKYYLASGSGNGNTLREAGIFNSASGVTMYCRTVLSSEIVKTSSIAVTFTWTLQFQAV